MSEFPTWSWAVPLIASFLALCGVGVTIVVQWSSFNRQLNSAHALKVAEMRQAWINNLREAMSTFQSYGVTPDLDQDGTREFYEAGTRIELLMNPKDKNYERLHRTMYAFLGPRSAEEKYEKNPEYVDVCQEILKGEWEVLKAEVKAATGKKR